MGEELETVAPSPPIPENARVAVGLDAEAPPTVRLLPVIVEAERPHEVFPEAHVGEPRRAPRPDPQTHMIERDAETPVTGIDACRQHLRLESERRQERGE